MIVTVPSALAVPALLPWACFGLPLAWILWLTLRWLLDHGPRRELRALYPDGFVHDEVVYGTRTLEPLPPPLRPEHVALYSRAKPRPVHWLRERHDSYSGSDYTGDP